MTHMQKADAATLLISLNNIQAKVNAQEGNTLPVSAFKDYVDGTTPSVLLHMKNVVLQ